MKFWSNGLLMAAACEIILKKGRNSRLSQVALVLISAYSRPKDQVALGLTRW